MQKQQNDSMNAKVFILCPTQVKKTFIQQLLGIYQNLKIEVQILHHDHISQPQVLFQKIIRKIREVMHSNKLGIHIISQSFCKSQGKIVISNTISLNNEDLIKFELKLRMLGLNSFSIFIQAPQSGYFVEQCHLFQRFSRFQVLTFCSSNQIILINNELLNYFNISTNIQTKYKYQLIIKNYCQNGLLNKIGILSKSKYFTNEIILTYTKYILRSIFNANYYYEGGYEEVRGRKYWKDGLGLYISKVQPKLLFIADFHNNQIIKLKYLFFEYDYPRNQYEIKFKTINNPYNRIQKYSMVSIRFHNISKPYLKISYTDCIQMNIKQQKKLKKKIFALFHKQTIQNNGPAQFDINQIKSAYINKGFQFDDVIQNAWINLKTKQNLMSQIIRYISGQADKYQKMGLLIVGHGEISINQILIRVYLKLRLSHDDILSLEWNIKSIVKQKPFCFIFQCCRGGYFLQSNQNLRESFTNFEMLAFSTESEEIIISTTINVLKNIINPTLKFDCWIKDIGENSQEIYSKYYPFQLKIKNFNPEGCLMELADFDDNQFEFLENKIQFSQTQSKNRIQKQKQKYKYNSIQYEAEYENLLTNKICYLSYTLANQLHRFIIRFIRYKQDDFIRQLYYSGIKYDGQKHDGLGYMPYQLKIQATRKFLKIFLNQDHKLIIQQRKDLPQLYD